MLQPIIPGLPIVSVKAYWWRKVTNFGDWLAPHLLDHFADADLEWGTPEDASIVTVGSVLEHLPPLWSGYICGTGKLIEDSKIDLTNATVLALRGPLSAKGIKGSFALGDPGLLADELVGPQIKHWDLGVVPHWRDEDLYPMVLEMFRSFGEDNLDVKLINPRGNLLTAITEIGSCRRIITSSLHGMITADAFGIPRRVERAAILMNEFEGGDFKFRDYSESIHTPLEFGKMMEPSRWAIEDAKYSVFDAYKVLEKELHDL